MKTLTSLISSNKCICADQSFNWLQRPSSVCLGTLFRGFRTLVFKYKKCLSAYHKKSNNLDSDQAEQDLGPCLDHKVCTYGKQTKVHKVDKVFVNFERMNITFSLKMTQRREHSLTCNYENTWKSI